MKTMKPKLRVSKAVANVRIRSITPEQRRKAIAKLESRIFYGIDGCWYWISTMDRRQDHGRLTLFNYKWTAYRASYELYRGPIPDGLFACHSCDNRLCVNPDHLWLGTHTDNVRDFFRKGHKRKYKAKVSPRL